MIRACLFDLDGTLLPLDTDRFIEVYLRELAPYVAHVIPPDQLIPSIWRATKAMIEDEDPEKTNEEVFRHHFLSLTGLKKESIWPLFEQFYRERF
ncbi:MAG: HAD family hydrolase, partial [Planifilum fulgidum]